VTEHAETRIVPYAADLMYAVVADVERYPEFLPWVAALRVRSREQVKEHDVVLAEMSVRYGALRERYTSRVVLDPVNRAIDVVQTEGPFRVLENRWRFTPVSERCRVDFAIRFEFRSKLLNAVAARAFERVVLKMTDAFEARAKALSDEPVQQN
jgi:coenzyme Q-binding protein COQ10